MTQIVEVDPLELATALGETHRRTKQYCNRRVDRCRASEKHGQPDGNHP